MVVCKNRVKIEQAWGDTEHNSESSAITGLKN